MRLLARIAQHDSRAPAVTSAGATLSYGQLAPLPARVAPGSRAGVLAPADQSFVRAVLGAWRAGAVAVPLSPMYPRAALGALVRDCGAQRVLLGDGCRRLVEGVEGAVAGAGGGVVGGEVGADDPAMILYTSGTTGEAKGVVWTHGMLDFQLDVLSREWRWSADDSVLNVLPLHHVHGVVNVVLSALYNGAHLEMHRRFDAERVWRAFCRPRGAAPTVFMAVPAVYKKLIMFYEAASAAERADMRAGAHRLRLFVCGSASLSARDYAAWREISGQNMLERYGMTETGMTLSNPYEARVQGSLGRPLPGVEVRLRGDDAAQGEGELCVRGRGVFREYWGRPEATRDAFVDDGWFATGDIVRYCAKSDAYQMLGRASTDVLKTGGYKVSAIEVEEVLRACPGVRDCCVVGLPDDVLGQTIAAVVMPAVDSNEGGSLSNEAADRLVAAVTGFAAERLPRYKVPRVFRVAPDVPRNILGKVQKKALVKSWDTQTDKIGLPLAASLLDKTASR